MRPLTNERQARFGPDSTKRSIAIFLLVAAAALIVLAALVRSFLPRISEEEIRERVISTIQSESEESFMVTGSLEITATTRVQSIRTMLPGMLNLSLGTSSAQVQVPGRVYYGFDVRSLKAENIRVVDDTLVIVILPPVTVLAAEPNLRDMQVATEKGWARTPASEQRVERLALQRIQGALLEQAKAHVGSSMQPQANTARALAQMLAPALASAGLRKPRFRFEIGPNIFLESGATPAGKRPLN